MAGHPVRLAPAVLHDHAAVIADRPTNNLLTGMGVLLATAQSGQGLLSLLGPDAYAGFVAKPPTATA